MKNRMKRRQNMNLVFVNYSHLNSLYKPPGLLDKSLARVVTWAGKRVLLHSKANLKFESFNRPEINAKKNNNKQITLSRPGIFNKILASRLDLSVPPQNNFIMLAVLVKTFASVEMKMRTYPIKERNRAKNKKQNIGNFPPASGRT